MICLYKVNVPSNVFLVQALRNLTTILEPLKSSLPNDEATQSALNNLASEVKTIVSSEGKPCLPIFLLAQTF